MTALAFALLFTSAVFYVTRAISRARRSWAEYVDSALEVIADDEAPR